MSLSTLIVPPVPGAWLYGTGAPSPTRLTPTPWTRCSV